MRVVEQSSLKGKLVEVAGRIIGMVVEDNKKNIANSSGA